MGIRMFIIMMRMWIVRLLEWLIKAMVVHFFWVLLVFLGLFITSLALVLSILPCERRSSMACNANEVTSTTIVRIRLLVSELHIVLIRLLLPHIITKLIWLLLKIIRS